MFGSNDSKVYQWAEDIFVKDYYEICKHMLRSATKPQVYLIVPPPLYLSENKFKFNQTIINQRLPILVPTIGEQCGLPKENIINLFEPMGGHDLSMPELFCVPDACDYFHPNEIGHDKMAKVIYKAIFGEEMQDVPTSVR